MLVRAALALLLLACVSISTRPAIGDDAQAAPKPEFSQEAADFFEQKVRPLLAASCFECHGPLKQQSGVRLDTREHLMEGNEDGPIVVADDPDNSRLVEAIRYDGAIQMPPKKKLPPEAIEALTAWVKMGAPWPDAQAAKPPLLDPVEAAKGHWAFQRLQEPAVPAGSGDSPIDRFIFAKLTAAGLSPSAPAERRVLIRRATYDLIGLPPTPEEVAAFEQDQSPDAFAKVVDRLLASPQYGERWGRYWLDIARYADTKGYVFMEERKYHHAYVYRDWVVKSINDDLPYDTFLRQQIAADHLVQGDNRESLAALGFLTVGRRFLNNQHDIIDDRIDVVTRGMMGLTVTCARCHDHKYDPIPTADYYSLYGVFASSTEKTVPLASAAGDYQKELQAREQAVAAFAESKRAELTVQLRAKAGDYLRAAHLGKDQPSTRAFEFVASLQNDLKPQAIERWRHYLVKTAAGFDPVFAVWHSFAAIPKAEFSQRAGDVTAQLAATPADKGRLNALVVAAVLGSPPTSLDEVADRYAKLLAEIDQRWQAAVAEANKNQSPPPGSLPEPAAEEVRQVLYGDAAPPNVPLEDAPRMFERPDREHLRSLKEKVAEWTHSAGAPRHAMVLEDLPRPRNQRVIVRGVPGNFGPEVPRQFPAVLAGDGRKPFEHGSGRLDLAEAIASRDNPLTARVLVNRVWLNHFGAGLVGTPSDFGMRSDPPTHRELLDYLASRFMDDGWSLKKLHRTIMLSSTYQQASADQPAARAVDPENRLLWRMNRRRLDFEALRDSLLAAANQLDLAVGGPPTELTAAPFTRRRTIYGFIDRQNLPGMFRTFDFATPDAHSPQRYNTIVPQQALFLMNSPFAIEQAQALARRAAEGQSEDPTQRVRRIYTLVFGRAATDEEVALGVKYLSDASASAAQEKLSPWERYAQALLLTNEFAYLD